MIPDDNRAVSIAVTHALTIAITTILISGLLLSAGDLLEQQEERVSEKRFNEIGGNIITHINSFDRLAGTGTEVTASVQPEYPERVAGRIWKIELSDGPNPFGTNYALNISSPHFDRTIQYPIETENVDIIPSTTTENDPLISLCMDSGVQKITLGECP
jgi:hypothetical protein